MIYALTLVVPVVLLCLLLVMERVEQPLRRDAVGERLVDFLDSARPEEIEAYVSEGFGPALERYWSRRRSAAMRRARVDAAVREVRTHVPVG
ncbi:MAG: hypothetical protein ACJ74O_08020 [Frankiaceae bacterium]